MNQLVLTVTRACNLRCSYCPTAKDGWPSLTEDDARRAVRLFAERYRGDVKLFGGEPLLVPEVVRAAFEAARTLDAVRYVQLSTNGLGLDNEWLDYLDDHPKAILALSLDGRPDDHRRLRRALPRVGDAYDHLEALRPRLCRMRRVVVTQTIAPATAARAIDNFEHLSGLGYGRFNFLPAYYLAWRDRELAALRDGLQAIADRIVARWRSGQRIHVRNLFTYAPTPFFNTGLVVDADRSIHPSNVGLSGALEGMLGRTRLGDLDHPPAPAELEQKAEQINAMLQEVLPPAVWRSTLAVDRELGRFCHRLYPEYLAARQERRVA